MTTEPAATTEFSPTATPPMMVAPAAIQTFLSITMGFETKPGPFGMRTHEMGQYIGIRDRGCLIAMAGERMRFDGYVEISAVCVDEDWRGRGLAGRLVTVLCREIERRGETPILHALGDNQPAIRLYERLGFALRRVFHLSRVGHAEPVAA